MQRREFLKISAEIGALAAVNHRGFGLEGPDGNGQGPADVETGKIGRPVRVTSIGYKGHERPLDNVAQIVDQEGSRGTDVIALGETWRGLRDGSAETLDGPAVTALAALAKKHSSYIVCPIDRKEGSHRYNSVVLLDREGRVASIYNKAFPWFPEFRIQPPIEPGHEAVVYDTDFGRLGFAICFDVFFPEVWQSLAAKGAELVIYPADASAGRLLYPPALNYHYYIVSATHAPDCQVMDITGEEILWQKADDLNISRVTLDLDRGIYNADSIDANGGNLRKRDKLLQEHSQDVFQDKYMPREDWFVLKAKRPGVSARELARSYGIEELSRFVDHSRTLIDQRRGWPYREQVCPAHTI